MAEKTSGIDHIIYRVKVIANSRKNVAERFVPEQNRLCEKVKSHFRKIQRRKSITIDFLKEKNMKTEVQINKFLSLVLRHKPETIDIQLDQNGWADIETLLEKANISGVKLNKETLIHIVETDSKKRFAFNESFDKIRASQGHSIDIELGYTNQKPPEILYHGTGEKSIQSILKAGLERRNRQHVHLSSDIETAIKVGQRHGKPFVFNVLAGKMYNDKFEFFLSDNGVWLTENVPVKYLETNDEQATS
jgi:putative RNA 2'-phosphotransferase